MMAATADGLSRYCASKPAACPSAIRGQRKCRVGDPVFAVGNHSASASPSPAASFRRWTAPAQHGGSASKASSRPTRRSTPAAPAARSPIRWTAVGINTAIYSRGGNVGIGFSVPSNLARAIATRLLRDGKITRGFFGARSSGRSDILRRTTGIAGPARGIAERPTTRRLENGNIITAINGQPVSDRGVFHDPAGIARGVVAPVSMRKTRRHPVTLGDRKPAARGIRDRRHPGTPAQTCRKGIEIASVRQLPAVRKFKAGQIITALNGEAATRPSQTAIRKGVNTFTLLADGGEITVILRLE
jgi:S1-C subfamily serine protease